MSKKWSVARIEEKISPQEITFGKKTAKLKNLTGKPLVEEIKAFFVDNKMKADYQIKDGNNVELNMDTVLADGGIAFPLTVVEINKPS